MALGEAILVCLTEGPMSGYDLARRFDTSIGFFWRADHQQIYRELRRLQESGLVEAEHVVQTGRPNKNVWQLTDEGRRRLLDWSRGGGEPPSIKDDMMVKLYALPDVDVAALRDQIAQRRQQHAERLRLYEQILATRYADVAPDDPARVGKHLGLQLGLRYEAGWRDWCDRALADLARIPNTGGAGN